MDKSSEHLKAVWAQIKIPVILRRTGNGEKLRMRSPDGLIDDSWLTGSKQRRLTWISHERCFEAPKLWFNHLVERCLEGWKAVYVIQPYREQEKCSPACMNATGHECQCSCMGMNHGAGNDGSWFEVTEAFATRWGERELACRLMVRR
ncbi:MAG: hypothetical protein ABJD13_07710 [Paracoccaceae bacterium]